ncbi:MAG: diaminopimelate decarboxylase [Alphaproteobacteria bacterium]|nr:diaminopimelate decarboxylase [Alphaproteobacteria bacterium]
MTDFDYRGGVLHAEDIAISDIAAQVATPFYCYSSAALTRRYTEFADALSGQNATICYAVKANSNQAVIRTFADLGAGADVVSEGELRRALAAGVPADRIIFSGVGKTRDELAFALAQNIHKINVESVPELQVLGELAANREVEIGIRVNPDVDAKTHEKISTGRADNKFGIDIGQAREIFAQARAMPGVTPVSVAVHIGSQLTDLAPLRAAYETVAELVAVLRSDGHNIDSLDLGGGLGIRYKDEVPPSMSDYARMVQETTGNLGCQLFVEPGRMLVGNAGVLVTQVIYDKHSESRRFVIVDAAMNDLIRPALYDAYHLIRPAAEPAAGTPQSAADIVGPICETGDTFTRNRQMPALQTGDLLVFDSAGAYGAVMSSTYNSRLLIPEILVNGKDFAVIRPRPDYDELLKLDRLAKWQQSEG